MITEQVDIKTPDGIADAFLFRKDQETCPGVLVLTDIMGYRPAYAELSKRIASYGFVVLTPNIFYRWGKPPIFSFPVDFEKEETTQRRKEITAPLTTEAIARDNSAFVDFLSAQPRVSSGPISVVGFCYTGKDALRLAAMRNDRIGAAASFHGGGLYTENADSPHHMLPNVKARLYFGHAENDGSMPAPAIENFEQALNAWGGQFESETYPAGHGWMIPGRPVHNAEQAERGFRKLMDLFAALSLAHKASAP